MPRVELDLFELELLIEALGHYRDDKNWSEETDDLIEKLNVAQAGCFNIDKVIETVQETIVLVKAEDDKNAN